MKSERIARLLVFLVSMGPAALVVLPRIASIRGLEPIEIRARVAEDGGWSHDQLEAVAGKPLHLRLTSDDVVHGFAIAGSRLEPVEVEPGRVSEVTVTFDRPGSYTYYCTRWCGVDHWRMRGTIEVSGPDSAAPRSPTPPLYELLGVDIDADHSSAVVPSVRPSAERGELLSAEIPPAPTTPEYQRAHSLVEWWYDLREAFEPERLSDQEIWDLVAFLWERAVTPAAMERGAELYAANCSACHGERGAGDGVMAPIVARRARARYGPGAPGPADFTDPVRMLGASPAQLQGKIIRGGMGTGMPNWGPILSEEDTWALVDYLISFQFSVRDARRSR